ncbi:MAG: D-alanyl-D-alanine carboxypeptidase family protein [Armatimonadia bacterium]
MVSVAAAQVKPRAVPYADGPGLPAISAEAAILMDADSGRVLFERHSDRRMYPASLTKMMTGLLACESGDLQRIHQASKTAAETGESSIALTAGEPLKLEQVLQASLIKSANDATVMVAECVGGSVPAFVEMMNNRAAAMGLRGTHFANPHGLHRADHYSTAADLCELARQALQNESFAAIVGTRDTCIPWAGKPWMRKLVNRNRLLLSWNECDGVKTGYTRQAGRCLAASASRDGWRLVCVVLKCGNSWTDARTLLEWGFSKYQRTCIARADDVYNLRVRRGAVGKVSARPERDVFVILDQAEPAPKAVVAKGRCEAPIMPGQVVGTLQVTYAGKVQQVRLLALEEVPLSLWARLCNMKLPQAGTCGLVFLAAGVLLHGAGSKAARARRRRVKARRRKTDTSGSSDGRRADGTTGD